MAAQGTDKEAAWVGGRDFIPHTNPQELTTAPTMMHDEIALPALRLILGDYSLCRLAHDDGQICKNMSHCFRSRR